jgi:hypothetical protein
MNAFVSDVSYSSSARFSAPPILVVGDSPDAIRRGVDAVESSGYRVADQVALADAAARWELQSAASALWIEMDEDRGSDLDRIIALARTAVSERRCGAVVAVPTALIDAVASLIDTPEVEVVVGGGETERASALAVTIANATRPARLFDATADRNAERLRQLSDEVSRIASTLARLSTGPEPASRPSDASTSLPMPEVSADTVHSVIRARRLRSRFFPEGLFADPAWDMLLDLLQAEIAQLRVPVSSLCIAAAVPPTTALRWLKTMTEEGLFVRRSDPHDGRRVFVELAPQASQALRRYFAEVGTPAVI